MIGILYLRSLGYYKIRQGVLQQNLRKYYHFEPADRLCEEFNTLVHELKKDKKILDQEKYPWLEDSDERKYMTDREILDKYIDLDKCKGAIFVVDDVLYVIGWVACILSL